MFRKFLVVTSLAFTAQVQAAEAGKVIFAQGAVRAADQPVAEGAAVQEGQLLSTGADSFLYIRTADNGLFILRPNTKARIAAYHIDRADPSKSQFKLELISGVARSKSGDAVKLARQNFRFNTPVAAIGVRGTDFTVFTDQDTSRVAVLTGGIVVSGFGGGCRPEGGGPCEGGASRELSATQRGQLLQVKRGQLAPVLVAAGSGAPDLVSPPRSDEPLAKTGNPPADAIIDTQKVGSLEKLVQKPATPAPVVIDQPKEPTGPVVPERDVQWGRWAPLLGQPVTATLAAVDATNQLIGPNFVITRTPGKDYVTPERGNVGFVLKNSEAYIVFDDPTKSAQAAQVQNGVLNFDFGKATFATSFDLVGGGETHKMVADGYVASDGRFSTNTFSITSNTSVNGVLSNANGGSAAYLFQRRLDEGRTTNGVTYWAH